MKKERKRRKKEKGGAREKMMLVDYLLLANASEIARSETNAVSFIGAHEK